MNMKTTFLERMKEYLKNEYDAYLKTLEQPMYKGLSINTSKCDASFVLENLPIECTQSSFYENCTQFYLPIEF